MKDSLVTLCLAVAMAVATVSTPLVGVLAPLLRDEIEMPAASVGLLVGIYAGVSALASWPAGLLTDRIGGRRSVAMVFAVSAVALVGIASAESYARLIGAMIIGGLANSMVNPATNQVIAESVDPGRRGLVAGIKMAGVQVAVFAVGLLIPLFDAKVGWRLPTALGALLLCVGGSAIALTKISSPRELVDRRRTVLRWSSGLVALTAYSLLMSAGASASLTFLPLYSVDELGATVGGAGLSVAVAGLLAIGGRLFWGRATERSHSRTKPLLTIASLSVVCSLLLLWASEPNDGRLWIGSAGLGFFALSFSAATTVALILSVAKGTTGAASGVMFTGFMVGFGLGPAGFGFLVESTGGYATAWIAVSAVFTAAVAVSMAAIKSEAKALPSEPAPEA